MGFGIRDLSYNPGFTELCEAVYVHIFAINVSGLANGLTSLSSGFLMSKMRPIIIPT